MNALQTYVWVTVLIMGCQALAIVFLSGAVGWFILKRRLVDYEDFANIKLLLDSNEKRISVVENVIKPILSISSTGSSSKEPRSTTAAETSTSQAKP